MKNLSSMDYSKLNLTKLKEQLKERSIDGRSKLTTKDMIIPVLKLHDNKADKEQIRKLVLTILSKNKQPTIDTFVVEQKPMITPKIGFSFDEINNISIPARISVIDLTHDELIKKADQVMAKSRKTLQEIKMIKQETDRNNVSNHAVDMPPLYSSQETIKLEIPMTEFERLIKMVSNYEKSRMRSREYMQKKNEKDREEKNAKLIQAGLVEMVKTTRKRDEPLVKEMNLNEYIVSDFVNK